MASKVPTIKFNNGEVYPVLGLGTWKSKPGEVTQAVKDAIDLGYRHFDCALIYQNEKEVGVALEEKMKEGAVKREDLFITSKLWNTFHRKDLVVPSIKQSLKDLRVDYLDLYLIHWPMAYKEGDGLMPQDESGKTLYSDADNADTWKAMEECVRLKLAKSIGVCNFNSHQLQEILDVAQIKPVNNQIECHPYLNQRKLIEFCKSKEIVVTAYSPLGSPDRPWAKPEDVRLLDDTKIGAIAERHGKTPAQILIRYQIDRGVMVIPKSVTKSRIESNFNVFDFTLTPEEIDDIDNLGIVERVCHLDWIKDHKDYPFSIEF